MADPGWPWTDPDAVPVPEDRLAQACARLFAGSDGALLLAHLTRVTLGTTPGADATEARLRHLEGQRALVLSLRHWAARGGLSSLPPII